MRVIVIIGLILLAIAMANLWWRWASGRRSLPCPTAFAWLLENPLMSGLIGTQLTLQRLALRPGQRVLEIGPGPGRLLIPAARRVLPGGRVVGLDIQPGMARRLVGRAAQAGLSNLHPVVGDARRLGLAPECFDLVFLCTVLGEFPERHVALGECWRVLKPGGVLSVSEIFPDPHFQSRRAVRRVAEAAGFRLQSIEGSWHFFTARFVKALPGGAG